MIARGSEVLRGELIWILGTPQPNSVETVKQRCGEFLVEQAYINGQFISTGKTFEVHDPSNDQVIANVTVCDAELTNQGPS